MVVKPISYKVLFAIAAALDLEIKQLDVKTAFLYGNIDEEIYVKQPKGQEDRSKRVYLLNKALYGLKQALCIWFFTLALFLKDFGFFPLSADLAVFCHKNTYIAVYVDDMLIVGPLLGEFRKSKKNCIAASKYRILDFTTITLKCLFVKTVSNKFYL